MYPPFYFISIIYFKLHSYVVIKMKDEIFCFHMHEGVRDLNDFSLYTLKFLTGQNLHICSSPGPKGYERYIYHFAYIVIVSDLRQIDVFSPLTLVSSTNKTDCHNITEILLKVVLNTTTLTPLSSLLSGSFISHKPHGRFKVNLKEMLL